MLKEEFKQLRAQNKNRKKCITINLTDEIYQEICESATELGCSKAEYFRRLHKFAQQTE